MGGVGRDGRLRMVTLMNDQKMIKQGCGRKLVAIQTESHSCHQQSLAVCINDSASDCSRPSSRHVAAGHEHNSKKCRLPSCLCSELSRCVITF